MRRTPQPIKFDRSSQASQPRDPETGRLVRVHEFKPEYCRDVIQHMREGASFTSWAASVGVSLRTARRWCDENQEFAEARERGMALCQQWWERALRAGLFDVTESTGQGKERVVTTRRLNSQVARLVMANLFHWHDRQELDVNATVAPGPGSPEDARRMMAISALPLHEQREMVRLLHKAQGLDPDITKGPLGDPPPVRRLLDWADDDLH
jgi:hypothetical protein